MASFRPQSEKNAEDVKLNEIPAHVQPQTLLVTEMADSLKQLAIDVKKEASIAPTLKKLAQQVKDKSKAQLLKQVIEDRIATYPQGPLTGQQIMSANTRFKEDEDKMFSLQGKHKDTKLNHQRYTIPDGQTTMWSYEEKRMVTIAFEYSIVDKIFEECKTQHTAFGIEYTSKIPTFFKIINKEENIGIPKNRLHEVYICFFRICDPGKKEVYL